MKNKGKSFEQLVKAIQITLKDCPNTSVESNAHIIDNSGIIREIDVLVTTTVQSVIHKIAFECKEYSRKVSVSGVEAFYTKCMDIPEINKGIIVSSNGFTEGAIKKAKEHGITLCSLTQIDIDAALFEDKAFLPYPEYDIEEQFQIEFLSNAPIADEAINTAGESFYDETGNPFSIYNYVLAFLGNIQIQCILVKSFLENGKRPIRYCFSIKPSKPPYCVDNKRQKHLVISITGNVTVNFKLLETSSINGKKMTQGNTNISAIEYGFENTENKLIAINTDSNKSEFFVQDSASNMHLANIRYTVPIK